MGHRPAPGAEPGMHGLIVVQILVQLWCAGGSDGCVVEREIALLCPGICLPQPPWAADRVRFVLLVQAGLALEFIPLSVSLGDFIYCFCPFSGV